MKRTLLLCSFLVVLAGASHAQRFVQQTQRIASPLSPVENFGAQVDIDGDIAVVNAGQESTIFVYERTGGVWAHSQDLVIPGSSFGGPRAVVSGDTIAVSQPVDERVDLYEKVAGSWMVVQTLNGVPADDFGFALAIEDDTLVVGAPGTTIGMDLQLGMGYVYRRNAGVWGLEGSLLPSMASNENRVGSSVALSGDTLILGAIEFGAISPDNGSAYVYTRSGSTWTEQQQLRASDGSIINGFGTSVAIDGDAAAILDTIGGLYVFERSAGVWTEIVKLSPEDVGGFNFYSNVSMAAGTIALGFPDDATLSGLSGCAYLFSKEGGVWQQVAKVLPEDDPTSWSRFSRWVALDTQSLICGASFGFGVPNQFESVFFHDWRAESFATTCYGDGASDFPGCASCPCGNNAPTGTRGGCVNSRDRYARLTGSGTPSVSSDTLQFDLVGASAETFALLFSGSDLLPQSGPCPPGSGILSAPVIDGLRCTGGSSVVRLGVRATDSGGQTVVPWGGGVPASGLIAFGGLAAGETRHFQCFYREFAGLGCGSGQNSTNAVSVTLTP